MPTQISLMPAFMPFVTSMSMWAKGVSENPQKVPLTKTVVFRLFCGKWRTNERPIASLGTSTRVRYQTRWANIRSGRAVCLSLGTGIADQRGFTGSSAIGTSTGPGSFSSARQICQRPLRRTEVRSPGFALAGAGRVKSVCSACLSASVRWSSPGRKWE